MNRVKKIQRSPLAIAVLALLAEKPMHPYRMQQLIKERGKDEVINVRQRTNIYQTIERLLRDGLIEVRETLREAGRPDRTMYEATEEGKSILVEWLRGILSEAPQEFPEFPAALSFLGALKAEDVLHQLEQRSIVLETEIGKIDATFQTFQDMIPRLFMIESEYKRTMLEAELTWVRSVIADLSSGALTWDDEWLREISQKFTSSE